MWNWDYTNIDCSFFEKWSPETSYILGFFIADGNISDYYTTGRYGIRLQCNDRDVIEKIAYESGYINKTMEIDNRSYRIMFSGKFIWNFFTDLGFDNNKTHNAKIPKEVPIKFYRHLIRGIFDGDGSVSIKNNQKGIYPYLNVVGSKNVIDFIASVCPFYNTSEESAGCWRIDYNGEKAVKFLDFIYKDATIYMNRKYKIYKKIKQHGYTNKYRRWSQKEINFLVEKYPATYAKDLKKVMDRSWSSIVTKAERLGIKRNCINGKI